MIFNYTPTTQDVTPTIHRGEVKDKTLQTVGNILKTVETGLKIHKFETEEDSRQNFYKASGKFRQYENEFYEAMKLTNNATEREQVIKSYQTNSNLLSEEFKMNDKDNNTFANGISKFFDSYHRVNVNEHRTERKKDILHGVSQAMTVIHTQDTDVLGDSLKGMEEDLINAGYDKIEAQKHLSNIFFNVKETSLDAESMTLEQLKALQKETTSFVNNIFPNLKGTKAYETFNYHLEKYKGDKARIYVNDLKAELSLLDDSVSDYNKKVTYAIDNKLLSMTQGELLKTTFKDNKSKMKLIPTLTKAINANDIKTIQTSYLQNPTITNRMLQDNIGMDTEVAKDWTMKLGYNVTSPHIDNYLKNNRSFTDITDAQEYINFFNKARFDKYKIPTKAVYKDAIVLSSLLKTNRNDALERYNAYLTNPVRVTQNDVDDVFDEAVDEGIFDGITDRNKGMLKPYLSTIIKSVLKAGVSVEDAKEEIEAYLDDSNNFIEVGKALTMKDIFIPSSSWLHGRGEEGYDNMLEYLGGKDLYPINFDNPEGDWLYFKNGELKTITLQELKDNNAKMVLQR